jgi:hypothetical protein
MRRMSFALTTEAVKHRTKTVTRRLGWAFAKPGDRYLAVDKLRTKNAQKLAVIEVVDVREERLHTITDADVAREGFVGRDRSWFLRMFIGELCHAIPEDLAEVNPLVRRIEFRYVDAPEVASA